VDHVADARNPAPAPAPGTGMRALENQEILKMDELNIFDIYVPTQK
jgi:hypothetical protein